MWSSIAKSKRRLGAIGSSCRPIKVSISQTLTPSSSSSPSPSLSHPTWISSKQKQPSLPFQTLRFFSQFQTETEVDHSSLSGYPQNENDKSLENKSFVSGGGEEDFQAFHENGDEQMDHFASGEEGKDLSEQFSWSFAEGGDAQLPEDQKEVPVYEIDMEKLEKVLSLLQSSVDASLESNLDDLALDLHEEFLVKVLETPLVSGENLIKFFNWAIRKSQINLTEQVVDALVQAICIDPKMKVACTLWDLIREIAENDNVAMNVETLNKLIALFSKLGKGKAALEVFNKYGDFGCVPNSETYYYTIEALCRRSFRDWAWSVCEKMLDTGTLPDSEKVGKIISWFCKGNKAKDAHAVYLLAKEKNKCPPQSAVNFLIYSLCQKDETVKLAADILDGFSGEATKYSIKPFSSVIRGLCRTKDVDGAKKLLSTMIAEGPPPGNAVFNLVINCHSKSGDMKEAMETMKLMESRGLKPDVYTYTVIMSGYVSGGQMEAASNILSEAKKKYSKLSPVTYHTLIRGYCKLEQFDKALEVLAEMKEFGVQPNVDEYNKLIQSLCLKALDWRTAEKLLEEMKENALHLNGITRGLIGAVKELVEEGLEKNVRVEA